MSNVVKFTGESRLPLNPDDVLEAAMKQMSSVLVIGIDKDGNNYYASSSGDLAEMLWWVRQFEHNIMNGVYLE